MAEIRSDSIPFSVKTWSKQQFLGLLFCLVWFFFSLKCLQCCIFLLIFFPPLQDLSLAEYILRLICLTSLWELEEGALVLAFGNTGDIAAFDFGFVSLLSGLGGRKSCSFIFHAAVFLSWLFKEAPA